MLDEFEPKVVNKDAFTKHYNDMRLEIVIEDMGWVSEAYRALHSLEMDSKSEKLRERVLGLICGMQHDLPLGNEADYLLTDVRIAFPDHKDYSQMAPYERVLGDLMQGYRKILKERHEEL